MGDRKLVVVSRAEEIPISYSVLSAYTENGLVYTAANRDLHLLLREPALLELALREHSAVIPICNELLNDEDSEKRNLALRALVKLATPDAIKLLLCLLKSGTLHERRLALQMLGKVVTPSFRDQFREIIKELVIPGVLDISQWTPTAVRVLYSFCKEEEIEVVENPFEKSVVVPGV
jgi:hypothetical protein